MTITRGDTKFLKVKFYDKNGTPIIIPQDAVIKFTVKNKIDGIKLFQKTMTNEDYDNENECYKLTIVPNDTKSILFNGNADIDYIYDFQLSYMQDETQVIETMDQGKFRITYDVTTD